MSRRAAFEHQHFQMRREPLRLAPPVVQHGRRANHQRRLVVLLVLRLQPREPRQGLQGFAEPHVVGQNSAQLDLRQMTQEIETVLLIRTQSCLHRARQIRGRNAFEILQVLAQRLGRRRIRKPLQALFIQMRRLLEADALRHRDQSIHTDIRHRFMRGLHGVGIQLHPA